MDLYHYVAREGNFGDDLNLWLWDEILPGWREAWPRTTLVGVGTLINSGLPRGRSLLVLGSGWGYGQPPLPEVLARCRFESVRGPRSAALLELPPEKGICDPAMILPDLPAFQGLPKGGRPIFVPHHVSTTRLDWPVVCDAVGMDYVSPQWESREVIRRLAQAPLVIAESMHAAIIADAFGTPWHAVVLSGKFLPSKWQDWGDSVGVAPTFHEMFRLSNRLNHRLKAVAPTLAARLAGRAPGGMASQGATAAQVAPAARLPSHPASAPARRGGLTRAAFKRAEAWQARRVLARLLAQPGQLSDRARLADAQARYRAVLARVRAEFEAAGIEAGAPPV